MDEVRRVEHLDEFDEADSMSTAFCHLMSEEDYEDQTSLETERALKELDQYLQDNPHVYYRVVCRKKQEELEDSGLFSFFKVKVMSALQGEEYTAGLVSPQQSAQQLAQLQKDMHKVFAYSEESKGRHSKRLASQRREGESTPMRRQPPRRTRLKSQTTSDCGTDPASSSLLSSPCPHTATPRTNTATPRAHTATPRAHTATPRAHTATPRAHTATPRTHTATPRADISTPRADSAQAYPCAEVSLPSSPPPLLPPPPPPPPPPSWNLLVPEATGRSKRKRRESLRGGLSPCDAGQGDCAGDKAATHEADVAVLKNHTQSLCGAGGLHSVHSELTRGNPLSRLRSTRMARSPGGTPLEREARVFSPREPLQRTLAMVLRQKFRSVRSPSPAACSPHGTSLNSTFSP